MTDLNSQEQFISCCAEMLECRCTVALTDSGPAGRNMGQILEKSCGIPASVYTIFYALIA